MRIPQTVAPLILLASILSAACGGPPDGAAQLAPRPDYLSADLGTLVDRANAWTAAGLRADGQLRMYWSGDEDSRHVDVMLFATSSGALNMSGRRSLAGRIFDLISDGPEFQLVVPDHGAHYLGTAGAATQPDPERPYFALRPHHMTEALLPLPLPTRNSAESNVVLETYPGRYALAWTESDGQDRRMRRKVWIERVGLTVSEINGFDGDGRIEFIARYSDFMGTEASAYPATIEVERPWEELVFRFDLTRADRNPTMPAIAFKFQDLPEGYRSLSIEDAMAEFRRERGG